MILSRIFCVGMFLLLWGTHHTAIAQNATVRGRGKHGLNPKTTEIIHFAGEERPAKGGIPGPPNNGEPPPDPEPEPGHEDGHFEWIGGVWPDAIPLSAVVDPALTFKVDLRGFPAGTAAAIVASFDAWDNVTAGLLVASLDFEDTTVGLGDGVNTYSLRNLGGGGVLASTFITWDDANNNGQIDIGETFLEMDIVHNSTVKWGTDAEIPKGKWFDVQNVGTHEVGHAFGLDHPGNLHAADEPQTMFATSPPKETKKRTLGPDGDIPGIQSVLLGYGAP